MGKRTRLLPLAAAALFLISIFLPYWLLAMDAPTYPERTLRVDIYATQLKGDVEEWNRVSRLVGVKVPPPLPELDLKVIPAVMAALAALSLAAALGAPPWPGWPAGRPGSPSPAFWPSSSTACTPWATTWTAMPPCATS